MENIYIHQRLVERWIISNKKTVKKQVFPKYWNWCTSDETPKNNIDVYATFTQLLKNKPLKIPMRFFDKHVILFIGDFDISLIHKSHITKIWTIYKKDINNISSQMEVKY